MKRKIRKKRQLRIQRDKEQAHRQKEDQVTLAFEMQRRCQNEFAVEADSPEYLYIHASYNYGCSLFPPVTIVFLFDIAHETVKYAEERMVGYKENVSQKPDERELTPEEFLLEIASEMVVSLREIGKGHFNVKDVMEEMFSWVEPDDIPYVYDSGGFSVFIKNGKRKRLLGIQDERYYPPFMWLLRFFRDVAKIEERQGF